MYILAFDLFRKTQSICIKGFGKTKRMHIWICISEILEIAFKPGFSEHNNPLILCDNSQW